MADSFNHFEQVANALPDALSQVVRKTALDIQANAVAKAPVDTGFLKNSIYTVTTVRSTKTNDDGTKTKTSSTKSTRRKKVAKKNADLRFPEIPPPPNAQTAYVVVGAKYGLYVEFGTTHTPAHPYFYPALEAGRATFDAAMSAVEKKLAEAAQ